MIKAVKIRLRPNKQQEKQLWKSAGVARFAYNWALSRQEENHKNGGKFLNDQVLRKEFTALKQQPEYSWLYDVSNNVAKQAVKDACIAYKNFFSRKAGFPRFKSKRLSTPAFYNDNVKLKFKENKFLIEKVGWVRVSEPERVPCDKYYNPRITYDGKYWYISVGRETEKPEVQLTDESIGIDLGIKTLAVCSNNYKVPNINKSKSTKKQAKKLRRLQRKISRKYEINKKIKTRNIVKLKKEIRRIHRKLASIRLNHIHQATAAIVKTKPSRVVTENLSIKEMMKNKHLSKAISEQGFYNFKRILEYKCDFYGIEFVEAGRFYPSSKICCKCGYIKKDLKVTDIIFKCPHCSNEIDRDEQASINLACYLA